MARDYTKIKAWQLADQLALLVYKATKKFPKGEVWGLTSQMRRSAVSVAANIVEGSAKKNRNYEPGSGRFEKTSRVNFLI